MAETTDSVMVQTRYGRMLALRGDRYITRCLQAYGEYCEAEADLFRQIVGPGMTVVEAGANIGVHTLMLARACAPGRLIAFEPQQRVFQLLCANLALAEIGTVTALPEALGAQAGVAEMPPVDYAADGNFGSISPLAAGAGAWAEGRTVRVTPLDDLALTACDVLKVDVEGWEAQALRGARETIARCRPILYVENDRASHQAELIALIDELGYVQYWHVAPLFSPANFNGATQDFTGAVASLNMLCVPRERDWTVTGFERIDPLDWRSPLTPIGAG
ncbi:MAG: FkbM family methyltransferase [Caulobacterales bacterium]